MPACAGPTREMLARARRLMARGAGDRPGRHLHPARARSAASFYQMRCALSVDRGITNKL